MNMQKLIEKKQILFYSAYFLYLVATVLQTTMFTQYVVLNETFIFMRYASFGLAAIKIFLDLQELWKKDSGIRKVRFYKKDSFHAFAVCLLLLLLVGAGSVCTDDRSLLFVMMLLLAAREVKLQRVLKYTLHVQIGLLVFVLLSSSAGIIPDLLFKRDATPIRHALGYTYPSVMVTYLFFILLLYFWIRNTPINKKEFVMLVIIDFLVYKLTDSKTGFLMIAFLLLVLWGMSQEEAIHWISAKYHENPGNKTEKVFCHIYDYLAVYLTAILLLLCLTLPLKVTQLINGMLTDRVRLTVNAIRQYGIHPLGTKIEWIGFGGSLDTDSLLESYNFVDSSYGYILVNYGWMILILALAGMVWCCRAVRTHEGYLRTFLFAMVLLYCFIEPRLLELQVNVFLLFTVPLLTEVLPKMKLKKVNEWYVKKRKKYGKSKIN